MTRIIPAIAVGVSAFLMGEASVEAQQPPPGAVQIEPGPAICEVDVYDQTRGEVSPALQRVIGEYANGANGSGLDVHVQILRDEANHGLQTQDDAAEFTEDVADACGWDNEPVVEIALAQLPATEQEVEDGEIRGVFDVYLTDEAKAVLPKSDVDEARGEFIDDLRDNGSCYQADVASLLDNVNPFDAEPYRPHTDGSSEPYEAPGLPDIPVVPIAAVGSALLALGAAGARVKRGMTINGITESGQEAVDRAQLALTEAIGAAEQQLSVLPGDDATELRALLTEAQATDEEATGVLAELEQTYNDQKLRFWPSKAEVVKAGEAVDETESEVTTVTAQLNAERLKVEERVDKIDELVTAFDSSVLGARASATKQTTDGWDIGHFDTDVTTFETVQTTIQELRGDQYVDKPADLIAEHTENLATLAAAINALPERRTKIDGDIDGQAETITGRQSAFAEAADVLADMLEAYDPSCYTDIDGHDEAMESAIIQMQELSTQANGLKETKSLADIEQAEETHAKFTEIAAQVNATAEAVHARLARLKEIQENLPGDIEQLQGELTAIRQFAFVDHDEDVEEPARDAIEGLETTLQTFVSSSVQVKRPAYLEIADKVTALKDNVAKARAQAEADRAEMINLRAEIGKLDDTYDRERSDLGSLVGSNRSDVDSQTETEADSYDDYREDTAATRESLRKQVADLRELIEDVDDTEDDARSDIRREQQERARIAAELARQAAQRAREAAAASSHITRSFNTGGGGGSSHSSGSW